MLHSVFSSVSEKLLNIKEIQGFSQESITENGLRRSHSSRVVIAQLDGNDSTLSETFDENIPVDENKIEVRVTKRKKRELGVKRRTYLKTIRRVNNSDLSLYLPNIAAYNHRSVWKKYNSMVTELKEERIGIGIHS